MSGNPLDKDGIIKTKKRESSQRGGTRMSRQSASVFDVAEFILVTKGTLTTMKLQKLVYYSQAWSLTWDEGPIFPEKILAWANGPVVYELFKKFQRQYQISTTKIGDPNKLKPKNIETIRAVLEYYGDKSSQWLSDLTHMESPWINARRGLAQNARGCREITHAALAEYYGSLEPSSKTN
jgi:uncharacterized phage-associated protein